MPLPTRRAARADLPTAWGGEIGADSPPGALRAPTSPLRGEAKLAPPPHPARCARRPPHCVGRRNWRRLPTRRARFASWPTSPRGGEARSTPHPARSLRELADLPTSWGGDLARGSGEDLFVRGDFGGIVQRGEVLDAATLERAPDQVVGEMRVLGQQRTVEVRAEDGSLEAAFGVILAVVAEAHAHVAERPGFRAKVRAAAVILKADQGLWVEVGQVGVDDHVADEPAFAGLGAHVDEADAGEPVAVGGLVVVAEKLVAATHGEHAGAAFYRALERGLFGLEEILVYERLLAILAAAEKEHIDVLHALGDAAPELDQPGVEVAPFGSLQQGEDVAAIPVDVHEIGIQPTDGERFLGHRDYVSQYGLAQPRLTSSARRSSIAVYVQSRWAVSPSGVASMSVSRARAGSGSGGAACTPAYLRRTARSWARLPAGTTTCARPRRRSKSTSQIHETSVPSAFLSFRPIRKFWPPARSTAVRRVSLKPAGFLDRTRLSSRPLASRRSCRPKAARKVRKRSAMNAGSKPRESPAASAASAL